MLVLPERIVVLAHRREKADECGVRLIVERIDHHAPPRVGQRGLAATVPPRQLCEYGDVRLTIALALADTPLLIAEASRQIEPFEKFAAIGRFEHEVERRLGGAAEAREAAARDDLAQARLAGLRAQGQADFLGARGGRADQRRGRVEDAAHRVEVVLDAVAGERLDDHPGAVGRERLAHVPRGADRVAHVVQAVEERDEVVAVPGIVLGRGQLERDAVGDARGLGRLRARSIDGSW